jgi:hypothetical protein
MQVIECVLDRLFQFAKRAVRGAIVCTGEDGKVDRGWMQQCGRGDSLVTHLQHRTWSQVTRCDMRVLTVNFCPLAHSTISARHGRVMVSRKPRGVGLGMLQRQLCRESAQCNPCRSERRERSG